jgi:hypothetical protein
MTTKCILWEKSIPGLLAALLDITGVTPGLRQNVLETCMEAQENNCDPEADSGQKRINVEILLKMSHKTLTCAEEDIQ